MPAHISTIPKGKNANPSKPLWNNEHFGKKISFVIQ